MRVVTAGSACGGCLSLAAGYTYYGCTGSLSLAGYAYYGCTDYGVYGLTARAEEVKG